MTLPAFDYREPETLAEAVALLVEHGPDARPLAGGTALVVLMRSRLLRPRLLVSLAGIPGLAGIGANGDLRIGAMTTHRTLERSAEVRAIAPLLSQACGRVASPTIRNMGTVGGSLAAGDAASDPAPALLALDARLTLTGPDGERTVPLDGFFRDFYETDLREGEVLSAIRVPRPPAGARSAFVKYTCLSEEDRAVVSVAAVVAPGRDATCEDVRLALGGVAPTPLRVRDAEAALRGQRPTAARIAETAELAAAATDPLADRQGSAEYRREMTRVWVSRVLEELTAPIARGGR